MADIAMCTNSNCPRKFKCYRYMAYNSEYQTVSEFSPNGLGECKMFWALKGEQIRVTEEWYTNKIKDMTPNESWAKIIGILGEERILRLNYQKVRVWVIERKLDKKTKEKIKLNFYLMKACLNKNNNLVLKTNRSPLIAEFYIVTDKPLILNPSQKVTIRIGEKDIY